MKRTNRTALIAMTMGLSLLAPVVGPLGGELEIAETTDAFVPYDQLPIRDVPESEMLQTRSGEARALLETVAVTEGGLVEYQPASPREVRTMMSELRTEQQHLQGRREAAPRALRSESPFNPDGLQKSVIGPDERRQITATELYPYRTVGLITFDGGICTGTLIGPRHVLTAGHCVYDIQNNRWYRNLKFSPGQNGAARPFGTLPVKKTLVTKAWTRQHRRSFDFAMVILDQNIGEHVGWMGFIEFDPNARDSVINGYPGDKPFGTMWFSQCAVRGAKRQQLFYDCDTFGGMSGSAVHDMFEDGPFAFGVHAYGVDSTGLNGATRLNRAVFEKILSWKRKH